jgi:GNAT superfamily N-acetyltransferase
MRTATLLWPRRADDLEACVALLAAVHASDGYPACWPDDPARWLAPDELMSAWIAKRADEVVGHVCLCQAEEGASAAIWSASAGRTVDQLGVVSRLFVAPAARRQGLGGLLLLAACEEACRRGLHPVLEVLERDRAAAALYERLGWRRAGPPGPALCRYVAPVPLPRGGR